MLEAFIKLIVRRRWVAVRRSESFSERLYGGQAQTKLARCAGSSQIAVPGGGPLMPRRLRLESAPSLLAIPAVALKLNQTNLDGVAI